MRIQLMHPPGECCSFRAVHQVENFTVIHTNGVHQIPVDFCGCERGAKVPYHIQLMRLRLWPATCVDPETATTLEALDQFTRISLIGRLNVYDYYRALEAATDGAGLRGIANVRQQLTLCVRQFRHVFMFKRSGRGHEPGGIAATPPGACALRCPACPNFDLNVPLDWATSPFRWLYRVILSMDANFRLNNKSARKTDRDPNLTDGRAYMAPPKEYDNYIKKTEGQDSAEPPCDCSRFGALVLANKKGGTGMRTTGIAGCFCARHEFVQPLGLATLSKGERYSTMDWVFCGALSFLRCAEVTACYDIACQWSKRLAVRMRKMKPTWVVSTGAAQFLKHHVNKTITYAVPKFHLYAHKMFCQLRYSLGLLLGTGATDGEGCERIWAGANPAASSLREMGPGGMSDTMDDMCSAWNWMKTRGIADLLCERMERALDNGSKQTAIFTEFTGAIEAEDASKVAQARTAIRTWEQDSEKKEGTSCPYYVETDDMDAQLDQAQGLTFNTSVLLDVEEERSLLHFIRYGFRIEQDRERFSSKHKTTGGTTDQVKARSQALKAMLTSVLRFRKEQEHHMPAVYAALTLDERDPDCQEALTVKLYLPSDSSDQDSSLGTAVARTMEAKLRWAGMADELHNLRHQLRLKGCINKFKLANITGQRDNTRAREAQDGVYDNIQKAANAYRRHRKAYLTLVGPGKGGWEDTMRELKDIDCRGLGDRLLEQIDKMSEDNIRKFLAGRRGTASSGETKYELPWIWYNNTAESGLEITDELMVEWCKSRARAQHWVQEVRLLDEEMRRVIEFSENMAKVWDARREPEERMDFGEEHAYASDQGWADGARAYACKQAWVRRSQASNWRAQFAELRTSARYFLSLHTSEGFSVGSLDAQAAAEAPLLSASVRQGDETELESVSQGTARTQGSSSQIRKRRVVKEWWRRSRYR
ncbi:unnamed protein product [Peniophora sp. CBMAI 1063]|nr:unnamed protein product [Peniophora sp. CBMAI 1063]